MTEVEIWLERLQAAEDQWPRRVVIDGLRTEVERWKCEAQTLEVAAVELRTNVERLTLQVNAERNSYHAHIDELRAENVRLTATVANKEKLLRLACDDIEQLRTELLQYENEMDRLRHHIRMTAAADHALVKARWPSRAPEGKT